MAAPLILSVLDQSPARLGLEDIVVNTWAFDPALRQHSYRLLAQAANLPQES